MTSTSFPKDLQDWQGRFIANLAAALARHDGVKLALWAPPGELPAHVTNANSASDAQWLTRLAQQGGIAHVLRTRKTLAIGTVLTLLMRLGRAYRQQPSDVVHVNWLQNAPPLWGNVAIGQAARQQIKDTVGTWDDCAGRYAAAYRDLLAPEHEP